jgi:hypothetical protein
MKFDKNKSIRCTLGIHKYKTKLPDLPKKPIPNNPVSEAVSMLLYLQYLPFSSEYVKYILITDVIIKKCVRCGKEKITPGCMG